MAACACMHKRLFPFWDKRKRFSNRRWGSPDIFLVVLTFFLTSTACSQEAHVFTPFFCSPSLSVCFSVFSFLSPLCYFPPHSLLSSIPGCLSFSSDLSLSLTSSLMYLNSIPARTVPLPLGFYSTDLYTLVKQQKNAIFQYISISFPWHQLCWSVFKTCIDSVCFSAFWHLDIWELCRLCASLVYGRGPIDFVH